VVAEPSNNRPLVGHKGALWLKGRATGRTAHGSMPEHGDNALCKALDAAQRLRTLELGPAHAELGAPTLALTTLHAGMNVNSIPDAAEFTVDLRTVPGRDNAALLRAAQALAGPDVPLEVLMDLAPVWTAPDHPWVRRVRELLSGPLGPLPEVETVQFFTDAASLRAVLPDLPILVLGPGDPAQAHQTDESCSVAQLEQAVDLYTIIARDWYGREETSC
jgi:succinyl-diaminopimelate desuccinylase